MSLTPFGDKNWRQVERVFEFLCREIVDRLEEDAAEFNNRKPEIFIFRYRFVNSKEKALSLQARKVKQGGC